MKTNCPADRPPTIGQLQAFRRTGRLPKVDIRKASVPVRIHDRVTGKTCITTAEHVPKEELGLEVAKSADTDLNSVFDNLSIFDGLQEGPEIVEKAAAFTDQQDRLFSNTFPTCLQPS